MLILLSLVTVKLTPLDPYGKENHNEQENHREIKLDKDKAEIEIGRASSNTGKGLIPAPDNTWFDYPILSRAHAKFSTSILQGVSTLPKTVRYRY